MKFTDKFISNLKGGAKQTYKRDSDGFAIRVLPSGVKTWLFIYTIAGKRRQMNLGDYPTISLSKARERLIDVRQVFKDGKDPQTHGFEWHRDPTRQKAEEARRVEEDRKNPSFKSLANDYLCRHAKIANRKSTWEEDERLLNKDVLPAWGNLKAKDITRTQVKALLEAVSVRGPALTANILKAVSKIFTWAVDEDILETTPCTKIKLKVPVLERDRTLSEAEVRAFLMTELPKASMSNVTKKALKLILVTGQRSGEVVGIHSREIDGRWWTIPVERSKNKQANRVYLTDMALEILGTSEGYYFPSPKNGNNHIDDNALANAIRKNLKGYKRRRPAKEPNAGTEAKMVKVKEENKMNMEHFTPHDLRRTCSTFLAGLGVSDETNDAVLGHKKKGIIKTYNKHRYDKEKQKALKAWERKLKAIVIERN